MITVNADGHPIFSRLHRPEDEKRMVVILDPDAYDDWLTCAPEEAPQYFRQWTKPLRAFAKPLPPRIKKIGRAHVCTPVTNAHLVCRLLLENKKKEYSKIHR